MGAPWSRGRPEAATYRLRGGGGGSGAGAATRAVTVEYLRGAGLGFVPWPGTFALAAFLDARAEELGLADKSALELGSGACSVSGLVAGHLCREVVLSDRPEVVHHLFLLAQNAGLSHKVSVKVLDWNDLEFTLEQQEPGAADLILLSDVVYYPHLWRPLVRTLLLLSSESTVVYWANCDTYPHLAPDVRGFLALAGEFFHVALEEDRPQREDEGPVSVAGGRVAVRSLRLADPTAARTEVERAMAKGCMKRCLF